MKLYQPQFCSKCCYIRPYGGYKVCSCPFFPAEMSILDVSSFKVNPDAVPDWCPIIKINNEIASMPKEKLNALDEIYKGLGVLLGMSDIAEVVIALVARIRMEQGLISDVSIICLTMSMSMYRPRSGKKRYEIEKNSGIAPD